MANIKSVKELILDEQKLVTYVSVSKELCVHINESKSLLESVVAEIKKKHPDIKLYVNFIISGLLNDNSARTLVCSETDLVLEKAKFRTLFYQHIYSVCQGLSGVDNAALVSVNKFEDFLLCTGLIKSNSCTKRTLDEIGTLKSKSLAAVETQASTTLSKKYIKEKPKNNISNGIDIINTVVKPLATKSEPSIKPEVISPKKELSSSTGKNNTNGKKPTKSIAGFFSKSNSVPLKSSTQENSQKNKTAKEDKIIETKKDEKKTAKEDKIIETIKDEKKNAKEDMIIETVKYEKNNGTIKEEKQKGTVNEKKMNVSVKKEKKKDVETEDMDVDVDEISVKKIKKEPSSATKKTKKDSSLSKIKKTAKVDKKRKRVLQVSDSESEEDPFVDNKQALQESDDEIPPTPTIQTVKITSGILNPKKKRKVVDKTYTDEDGYILTRKEEVYESCSEDEVEIKQPDVNIEKENEKQKANKIMTEISPPKEKKARNTKKKISPPQKGKQATMMNFFKKI